MSSLAYAAPLVNTDRLSPQITARPNVHDEVDTTDYSEPFAPTLEDEAALLGFSLIMDGEDPAPPREWSFERTVVFYQGIYRGWVRQAREEREELEAWLDRLDEINEHDRHEAEIIEAYGVMALRLEG